MIIPYEKLNGFFDLLIKMTKTKTHYFIHSVVYSFIEQRLIIEYSSYEYPDVSGNWTLE
jgi:nuclear transport factor 2 (NTF2) superfamily protein